MATLGASTTICPHCGRKAVVSASKGLWCANCRGGRRLFTWMEKA